MDKFYKWCNCERTLWNIYAQCYDTLLEANLEYGKQNSGNSGNNGYNGYNGYNRYTKYTINETKLVSVFRYMPQFIQSYIIQNAFKYPVIPY